MAEISLLRRVSGLQHRVRSLVIHEELRVKPLFLYIERSQLRCLRHLIRMPPGHLQDEHFLLAGDPEEGPSGFKGRTLFKYLGRVSSGPLCLGCCLCNPTADEAEDNG